MSSRAAVVTDQAPQYGPILSQAIVSNGFVYTSGSLGIDHETNKFVPGGPYERTVKALRNLEAILKAAGSDLSKTIKVTLFLSSLDYSSEVNRAYMDVFASVDPKPARSSVEVSKLALDAEVEIELVASL